MSLFMSGPVNKFTGAQKSPFYVWARFWSGICYRKYPLVYPVCYQYQNRKFPQTNTVKSLSEREREGEGAGERAGGREMVAISLYRGNLHRVPDVPRRWPMPPRAISVGEFRALLDRRSRALAQLQPSGKGADAAGDAEEEKLPPGEKEEGMGDSGCPKPGRPLVSSSAEVAPENAEGGTVARLEVSKEMAQDVEIEEGDGAGAGGIGPSCTAPESIASGSDKVAESKTVNDSIADGGASVKVEVGRRLKSYSSR